MAERRVYAGKIYLTRYWQTEGVLVYHRRWGLPDPGNGRVWIRRNGSSTLVEPRDWAPTLEAAQDRVKDKADRLRASLSCSDVAPKRAEQLRRLEIIARDGARVTEVGT